MPSTPTGPLGSQSPPSLPVGTIIGPVLGGISLLLGVAAAGFFLCRRWKRSKATQSLLGTARRRRENGYDHHAKDPGCDGDRRRDETSLIENMVPSTPISPLRFHDGAVTHDEDSPQTVTIHGQASTVSSPDITHSSRGANITASPLTGDRSSKHRAELTQRLETLQRTRSVLSSTTNRASRSEAGASRGRTTETAIRDLEAEIADLRATLTALNARLGDDDEGSVDLLPAYYAE